jgi:hypothetical protein
LIRNKDNSVLISADDFSKGKADSKWLGFGDVIGADIFSEPGVIKNGGILSEDTGIEFTTALLGAAYDSSQATHTSYWAVQGTGSTTKIYKRTDSTIVGTWTLLRNAVQYLVGKMAVFNGYLYYTGTSLGRFKIGNTVTMDIATPCTVTYTGHGMAADSTFRFTTTGALPTGVSAETTYYVLAANLTADTFRFSASYQGSAVNSSGSQSGVHSIWNDGWQTLNSGAHDLFIHEDTLYIGNGGYIAYVDATNAYNGAALDIQKGFSVLSLASYDTDLVYSAFGSNAFEGTQALTARWSDPEESWNSPDYFSANTHHGWVKGGDILYYISGFNPIRISYYDGARLIPIKEMQL